MRICRLSEQAEQLLATILRATPDHDGWVCCVGVPNNVHRDTAAEELKRAGYILSYVLMGIRNLQCTILPSAQEYFNKKRNLEYMEAIEMFIPLPQELKEKLKLITTQYEEGNYIPIQSEAWTIVEQLKSAGYLKKFERHIRNYLVKFSYEDLNYDFLEEQYNRQFQSGNNFMVYGGTNQFNTSSGHGTVNATQNVGIDCDRLNQLIKEVLESAPKDNDEQLETIAGDLREIQSQIASGNPNKRFLKLIFAGLNGIVNSVANCTAFVENLSKLQEFLKASEII